MKTTHFKMASRLVVRGYSSKCSANNAQVSSKNYCENCDKLETEYQKTLDELKSAELIIELLRAEMNPTSV
jgi:hypothetical protein